MLLTEVKRLQVAPYAMPGTDLLYGATSSYACPVLIYCTVLPRPMRCPDATCERAFKNQSASIEIQVRYLPTRALCDVGTGRAYAAVSVVLTSHRRYAVSGTGVYCYAAAMRCPVLT
eukprot:131417-Rhodomonas_salina.1